MRNDADGEYDVVCQPADNAADARAAIAVADRACGSDYDCVLLVGIHDAQRHNGTDSARI